MNRFVVIGLGLFGSTVARRLYELGHEVIALDVDERLVDAIGPYVTRAIAGDATDKAVLEEAGAQGADVGVVAIGDNLGASILGLLGLRDLKVKSIYVKVVSEEHARIAEALGAADTVFPERQAATNLASRITSGKLLHYTAYGEQFGIQEMAVPDCWAGKTLADLKLPEDHNIHVVAVHDLLHDVIVIPRSSRPLTPSDSLLVAGAPEHLAKVTTLR